MPAGHRAAPAGITRQWSVHWSIWRISRWRDAPGSIDSLSSIYGSCREPVQWELYVEPLWVDGVLLGSSAAPCRQFDFVPGHDLKTIKSFLPNRLPGRSFSQHLDLHRYQCEEGITAWHAATAASAIISCVFLRFFTTAVGAG